MRDKEFKNVGMHYKDIWKDKNLKPNEKLVLIYLIDYYSLTKGYSYKLRKQIEEETGISLKTVNNSLKSLENKGYITIKKYTHDTGRNNIYYIHKYLVAGECIKPVDVDARTKKTTNKQEAVQVNEVVVENGREQSTNELLVIENCKLTKKLTKDDIVDINKMDTDKLLQAIKQANKSQGNKSYHVNYLKTTYRNIENNFSEPHSKAENENSSNLSNNHKKSNTKANTKKYYNNHYPVKTKYHDSFNEHFRNYSEEELEAKLLKMQNRRI